VRHLGRAPTDVQRGTGEGFDAKSGEADTRSHYVNDGVDGANFVEMYLIERHGVDGRFCGAETTENGGSRLLHASREEGLPDYVQDGAEGTVALRVFGLNFNLGSRHAVFPDLFGSYCPAWDRQSPQFGGELLKRHTRVDKRTEHHVPAHTTEAIKKNQFHLRIRDAAF
jgi:hypothetical protein